MHCVQGGRAGTIGREGTWVTTGREAGTLSLLLRCHLCEESQSWTDSELNMAHSDFVAKGAVAVRM